MTPADETETAQEPLTGPGERLRAAREAQGYSFDDVVRELHLEANVVSAIERDDLDGLSAPVFVKGYLRSYARLVGLLEQDIVDAWQPAEQDPEEFRTVSAQRELKMGASLSMFMLWSLLALLVVAGLRYLLAGSSDDGPDTAQTIEQQVVPTAPAEAPLREDFVVEEQVEEQVVAEPVFVAEPQAEPVPVATPQVQEQPTEAPAQPVQLPVAADEPAAPDGDLELLVSFTAECWIELSASGRRLLYGLEKPGNEKRFTVQPPLRFFVGDADAVKISIGGVEYPIPGSVRTGRNTARFVLYAEDIEGLQ